MRADDGDIAKQGQATPNARATMARGGHKVHPASVVLINSDISVTDEPFGADAIASLGEDLAKRSHTSSMPAVNAAGTGASRPMKAIRVKGCVASGSLALLPRGYDVQVQAEPK